jgi:hypothetical protein
MWDQALIGKNAVLHVEFNCASFLLRKCVAALTNTAFEGMSGAFPVEIRNAVHHVSLRHTRLIGPQAPRVLFDLAADLRAAAEGAKLMRWQHIYREGLWSSSRDTGRHRRAGIFRL